MVGNEGIPELRSLIEATPNSVIAAIGLNVLHDRAREGDLDVKRPILCQRQWAQFDPMFCKPLISRQILLWQSGFHFARDVKNSIHVDLYLFHLKSADWKISHAIRLSRNRVSRSQRDRDLGQSAHFGFDEQTHDRTFFAIDPDLLAQLSPSDFQFRSDLMCYLSNPRSFDNIPRTIDKIPADFKGSIAGCVKFKQILSYFLSIFIKMTGVSEAICYESQRISIIFSG